MKDLVKSFPLVPLSTMFGTWIMLGGNFNNIQFNNKNFYLKFNHDEQSE